MPQRTLVSIYVAWQNGDAQPYLVYSVEELGEGRARLRAAQRVKLCESCGFKITDYRFDFDDGSTITVVK